MTLVPVHIDDDLAEALDALVDAGRATSRSDAIRRAVLRFAGEQAAAGDHPIVTGPERTPVPLPSAASGWDAGSIAMIAEEPW